MPELPDAKSFSFLWFSEGKFRMRLLQEIQQGGGLFLHIVADVQFQFTAVLPDDNQIFHNVHIGFSQQLPKQQQRESA